MGVPNQGSRADEPAADRWTTLWSAETCRVDALCGEPGQAGASAGAAADASTDCIGLVGEIDLEHADAIVEVLLARVAARPQRLDIDMSRLDFIDSFGVSRLIITQQAATDAGVQVALRGVRPSTRRVLDVSGLIAFLNVVDET
jgi:anti-anti-sigma factor